jgi:16S rRNA (cytosine1407-C5)-methyltransferase
MVKARYELPKEFVERLRQIVGQDHIESVLQAYEIVRPTTIRVNRLKSSPDAVIEALHDHAIEFYQVAWYGDALVLPSVDMRKLSELDEYKEGTFYVQSLSSMIPAMVLDPQLNEKVLDICAAPGSKTTQMASFMNNTGNIVACDNSIIRTYKLKANLETQGVTNACVIHESGQGIWQMYPEYFDRALVDVPCSMEGRFDISDPKSYGYWSTRKIRELSGVQKWLLRSAISAVKPGGTIVYSTCTLAPEENEGIIDWILAKEKGNVTVEKINIPELETSAALTEWKSRMYDLQTANSVRILPSQLFEGFFIAKLKKTASNIPSVLSAIN